MNTDTTQRSHLSWYFKVLKGTICTVGIPSTHTNIHMPCLHPVLPIVLGIAIKASVIARWEEIRRGAVIIFQSSYCGPTEHCFCFIQENLNLCIFAEYVINVKGNILYNSLFLLQSNSLWIRRSPSSAANRRSKTAWLAVTELTMRREEVKTRLPW